jgi:hypothetical protein
VTAPTAQHAPKFDYVVAFVKVTNKAFLVGALAVSFMHIVTVFTMMGLTDWQHWIAPLPIDGLMILGRLGMSGRFAETTRAAGKRLFLSMLALSLAANIAAGLHSVGGMVWGGMVILGVVVTEWYGPKLLPAPAPELTPAQRGAITRERKRAERKAAEEALRRTRKPRAKKATPAVVARRELSNVDLDAELAKVISTIPRDQR